MMLECTAKRPPAAVSGLPPRRADSTLSDARLVRCPPVGGNAVGVPRRPGPHPTGKATTARCTRPNWSAWLGPTTCMPCACSRKDLAEMAGDPVNEETPYGGRCRELGLAPGPGRGMRVVLEPGSESFVDLALGPQEQDPSLRCGDLLLRDRLGNWTYQFSVVVDDFRQGVHLVIRGQDLLSSTGRQLRLARMLGRPLAPAYLHHQLIYNPSGTKPQQGFPRYGSPRSTRCGHRARPSAR
jgi:hypothetical protein